MTSSKGSSNGYEVGYGRPPKATRWKKGSSGNPRGRPKGARNFQTELAEEIAEKITIREAGSEKKTSKLRVAIKTMVAKAMKGDPRAMALLMKALQDQPEPKQSHNDQLSKEDAALLEEFLKRHNGSREGQS